MKKNNNKRIISGIVLIITFMVMITGCVSERNVERPTAKGFTWKASKDGKEVILVGSMHPATKTHNLVNKELLKLIGESDVLSVEADITNDKVQKDLERGSYLEEGENIEKYLSTEEIDELMTIIETLEINVDKEYVEKLNSVGIMSIIQSSIQAEIGFNAESTDEVLLRFAKGRSIVVNELEGVEFQSKLMKKINTWEEVKEFIETYSEEEKEKLIVTMKMLFENYVKGSIEDANELEKILYNEDIKVHNTIFLDRNIDMTDKIDSLVNDGKKHVVAVGYRHFIGEGSILELLKEKGYEITEL